MYFIRNLFGGILGTLAFLAADFIMSIIISFIASIPLLKSLLYAGAIDVLIDIACILSTAFFAGLFTAGKISKTTENGFSLGALLYTIAFAVLMFGKNFNLFYYYGVSFSDILYALATIALVIWGFTMSFNDSFDD